MGRRCDGAAARKRNCMATLNLTLSDVAFDRLRAHAARFGVTPEEMARRVLEAWLDQPTEDFAVVARYVLDKNAELYRRLA